MPTLRAVILSEMLSPAAGWRTLWIRDITANRIAGGQCLSVDDPQTTGARRRQEGKQGNL